MNDLLNTYLENGLQIILHKIPEKEIISCGLWIKQGSCYETDTESGLSHLTEHLLINPETVTNSRYKELIRRASLRGVIYDALTTKEYTSYCFTGMANTIEVCISSLACIAKDNRSFFDETFENEKKVVLQEATGVYTSIQQIKERTSQAIWGNTGTGRIVIGDMQNIANATTKQISRLLQTTYHPANAVLAVVGNIDYDAVLHLINKSFQDWKDDFKGLSEQPVSDNPGVYTSTVSGASTTISIGFRAPAYSAVVRPTVEMMTRIIGQVGLQSRMAQEIRVKRGLAYSLGSFSEFYKRRGTLGFVVTCNNQKITDTASVLMEILSEAKEKGFTSEEVEQQKHMMEISLLLSVENITQRLRRIGRDCIMDYNFCVEQELKAIRDICKSDVDRVAEEILCDNTMGLAIIGQCDTDKLLDIIEFGEQ